LASFIFDSLQRAVSLELTLSVARMPRRMGGRPAFNLHLRPLRTFSLNLMRRTVALLQLDVKYGGLERWVVKGVKSSWISNATTILYDMVSLYPVDIIT
jgi:hypothetical protein